MKTLFAFLCMTLSYLAFSMGVPLSGPSGSGLAPNMAGTSATLNQVTKDMNEEAPPARSKIKKNHRQEQVEDRSDEPAEGLTEEDRQFNKND